MTTETILTDEQIEEIANKAMCDDYSEYLLVKSVVREAEQAVLQSPEVQRLRNIETAARCVMGGLNALIDRASKFGKPVPVFYGIADLHDALNAAMEKQP